MISPVLTGRPKSCFKSQGPPVIILRMQKRVSKSWSLGVSGVLLVGLVFGGMITHSAMLHDVYAAQKADKDPEITVLAPGKKILFRRSELLKHKDLTQLEIDADPLFPGKKMHYEAVPVASLFAGIQIPEDATIQYVCSDGFAASLSRKLVLNQSSKGSIAYLAIEKEAEKWPRIDPTKSQTAGTYYLVWKNPKASSIPRESWPYSITGFEVKPSLRANYPAIFPDKSLPENHKVNRGLQAFMKNCFACHTINKQGAGSMGPDLNVPMNPTEYFKASALKIFIRNTQDVRHYPEDRMHPFPKEILSDVELTDLLSYLTYMAQHKVK